MPRTGRSLAAEQEDFTAEMNAIDSSTDDDDDDEYKVPDVRPDASREELQRVCRAILSDYH